MSTSKRCFVIMPFSATKSHSADYWENHFKKFLKPYIENVENIIAFRSEPLRGNIAHNIIIDLTKSDIVVADLTDFNPNVLWELGVRQSFKNCTITIAESGTIIPFHFSHKGVFFYDSNHFDDGSFIQELSDAIRDCALHPEKPDSPVLEAITGRGTLFEIINKEETNRKIQALQLEYQRNKNHYDEVSQSVKQNIKLREKAKKDPKNKKKISSKISLPTTLMESSSIELLLTTRYVDEDQTLFKHFLIIRSNLIAINEHMSKWTENTKMSETWFGLSEKTLKNNFKIYDELNKSLLKKYCT